MDTLGRHNSMWLVIIPCNLVLKRKEVNSFTFMKHSVTRYRSDIDFASTVVKLGQTLFQPINSEKKHCSHLAKLFGCWSALGSNSSHSSTVVWNDFEQNPLCSALLHSKCRNALLEWITSFMRPTGSSRNSLRRSIFEWYLFSIIAQAKYGVGDNDAAERYCNQVIAQIRGDNPKVITVEALLIVPFRILLPTGETKRKRLFYVWISWVNLELLYQKYSNATDQSVVNIETD